MNAARNSFQLEKRLAATIAILLLPVLLIMVAQNGLPIGPRVDREALAAQKPNILFIQIDSLRADYLKRYGYPTTTAPFLESLFDKGVVFDKAIAPAYLTFQTDAAIFSGLYPSQNNVQTWSTPVRADITLLPKILNTSGYQTEAYVSPSLYPHFELFKDFSLYEYESSSKSVVPNSRKILANLALRQKEVPYFTFWHVYDVHLPYMQPIDNSYSGVFADMQKNWLWVEQSTSTIPLAKSQSAHTFSDRDYAYLRDSYETGIRFTDSVLKQFFEDFQEAAPDILANTLIIISAEHGEDLEEHDFVFHRDLYDVNTHVPLAIIFPKALRPQRISTPVSLLDLMPTIMSVAGIHTDNGTVNEGRDLLPLIEGDTDSFAGRYIYSERAPFSEYAVWKDSHKYILRNPSVTAYQPVYPNIMKTDYPHADLFFTHLRRNDIAWSDELYDTTVDPYEQTNLLGNGSAIEIELREAAQNFSKRMGEERMKYTQTQVAEPTIPLTYP